MNELEDKSKEYTEAKAQGGKWRGKRETKDEKDMWGIFTCLTFLSPEFQNEKTERKWNRSNMGFPHYPKVEIFIS